MSSETDLLKKRMQQLAVEIGGTFEVSKRPRIEYRPELTMPILNSLMKVKPVRDFWDKTWAEAETNQQFKDMVDGLEDYFVRHQHNGFSIVLKGTPCEHGDSPIAVTAKIKLRQQFILNVMPTPSFFPFPKSQSVSKHINADGLLKWLVPSKINEHWKANPELIYNVNFNLPTLNDMYLISASNRAIAEDFLNDWRIREYFLKGKDLHFSFGHVDIFEEHQSQTVCANGHFAVNEPTQFSNFASLVQLSIELFAAKEIIFPA
jgi:hypothetical protein